MNCQKKLKLCLALIPWPMSNIANIFCWIFHIFSKIWLSVRSVVRACNLNILLIKTRSLILGGPILIALFYATIYWIEKRIILIGRNRPIRGQTQRLQACRVISLATIRCRHKFDKLLLIELEIVWAIWNLKHIFMKFKQITWQQTVT